MLLKLKRHGIDKGYFVEKRLNELPEAKKDKFDNLYKEVIDYLFLYDRFKGKYKFKSADALIFKSDKKLKFIEFKGLDYNDNIEEYLRTRYFGLKVKDSFSLLNLVINGSDFGSLSDRLKFNKTQNEFIFSIACDDLDPRLSILLDMEVSGLEDYEKTLEKVFWVETKELENYL